MNVPIFLYYAEKLLYMKTNTSILLWKMSPAGGGGAKRRGWIILGEMSNPYMYIQYQFNKR